ncbi:hypothetical protein C3Z09_15640 [Lelliottia aquatilis]|nr:hypothetical protein C3Z09_15640 [Lelliottia aquatilis]
MNSGGSWKHLHSRTSVPEQQPVCQVLRSKPPGVQQFIFLKLSVDGVCKTCMPSESNFNDISITHPKNLLRESGQKCGFHCFVTEMKASGHLK